jgi:16S rRNA (guanine527-N7)-methyltransferase
MDVSRETRERLALFCDLVRRWNPRINLVSSQTLAQLETRHVEDSLQLMPHVPASARALADIGSGGGFPGVALAIAFAATQPDIRFTLVESDARKATFLREALRQVGIAANVVSARAEEIPPLAADVVTARALAPLPRLLDLVARHSAPGGRLVLPKGRDHLNEVMAARAAGWTFALDVHSSLTDAASAVLVLTDVVQVAQA